MISIFFKWILNLLPSFVSIFNWFITPLYANLTPLEIVTGSGIIVILGVWLIKFIIPIA